MPKSTGRARGRRPRAERGEQDRRGARQRQTRLAARHIPDQRGLLDRILDTPHLAQVVPRLQPDVLHRVIQHCGLEDCGELVALATADQLARVFDLDLWRSDRPGLDEQLDADRFGVWLEVLMDAGASAAAQKLVELDADLIVAALARHVEVFDGAAVSAFTTTDGDEMTPIQRLRDEPGCEVGGYLVVPKRTDAWDAIVTLLLCLDEQHPACFHSLMSGCRALSSSTPEIDGLHELMTDSEQDMFDLALARERRRDQQGYVTPAQAGAFLEMSRQVQLPPGTPPAANPIAAAYFRAIESDAPAGPDPIHDASRLPAWPGAASASSDYTESVAAVVDLLREAGVLAPPPRALLGGSPDDAPRLSRIQAHMQFAHDRDQGAYAVRMGEFAYLANALVAGCSFQGRPLTPREASDAAAAVCNLGLQNWPTALPEGFLASHDLISVFQVGWTTLHADVAMYSAARLVDLLAGLRHEDREVQRGLDALRLDMTRQWRAGTPWRAREALDVILILDQPAWATLLGLIDECPVMSGGLLMAKASRSRAVSASDFEFISENRQIASVREFFASLPETLRG